MDVSLTNDGPVGVDYLSRDSAVKLSAPSLCFSQNHRVMRIANTHLQVTLEVDTKHAKKEAKPGPPENLGTVSTESMETTETLISADTEKKDP